MMTLLHHVASGAIVACAMIKMNHMTPKTHWLDMVLWWVLGVAAFSELWELKPSIGWADTGFTLAVAVWALKDLLVSFGLLDLRKRDLGLGFARRVGDRP